MTKILTALLRQHQLNVYESVKTADKNGWFHLAACFPGTGKSMLPSIAFHELQSKGFVEKVCWVTPTISLCEQACDDFSNSPINKHYQSISKMRHSTNDIDPSRGHEGYSITYGALGFDSGRLNQYEFQRFRYLLVLDECHHLSIDSKWHHSVEPLFNLTKYHLLLSGTTQRSDKEFISFLPYAEV